MANLLQPSFSSGELAPSLYGRVDTARYQTGLRRCRNFFVRPHGGVSNRSGTRFVAATKHADRNAILVPFIFSTEQAYMLEFGHEYIWVYADGAPLGVATAVNIVSISDGIVATQPRRTITTDAPHGLVQGDSIVIDGVVATGSYDINGPWTVLTIQSPTVFRILGSGDPSGLYVTGGTVAKYIEIASPYQEADLAQLRFAQSADVLTIVHPDYPQREFRRLTATSFELIPAVYNEGPFLDLNADTSVFVHASARRGTVTLTATGNIFTADQVGSLFYLEQKNLALIPPWEPNKKLADDTGNTLGAKRRSDGKTYVCVTAFVPSSGKEAWTGTVRPIHEKGTVSDGDGNALNVDLVERAGVAWEYRDSGFGIVRITGFTSATQVTAEVLRALPDACVGGATTGLGPFTDTGDGVTTTLAIPLATETDRAMWEVTLDGVIQDIDSFEIDTGTSTLTFYTAPGVDVEISARQLSANNRTDIWAHGAWSEEQGYPSVVTFWQDRLVFAASRRRPQTVWGSKNGNYVDFGVSVPLEDSDALDFTMNARQINAIRDLLPLDRLIALTAAGAWVVTDGQNQVLTPTTVGFKPQSYRGVAPIPAKIIGDAALFAQEAATKIRTLEYQLDKDKFSGINLSQLASHLFKRTKTIVDFDYAEEPHSILWCIRSDGRLMGLTYDQEQQVIGWHRHDTKGHFERVCTIPEDGDNAVYFIVRREVNGQTVRYVERLAERDFEDLREAFIVDCGLSYDGRNTSATTMILTGSGWSVDDELTLTASANRFLATDLGDEIWLHIETEEEDEDTGDLVTRIETVRLRITVYTSATVVTVKPQRDVPEAFRSEDFTTWTFARDSFGGLGHLEGETVSIFADGSDAGTAVVEDAAVTLTSCGGVVHIGLPITADFESLDINVIGTETVRNRTKHIGSVGLLVQESRGIAAGPDLAHLDEFGERGDEDLTEPQRPISDIIEVPITASWNKSGRFRIRQARPLPITILGAIPAVEFGEAGA